MTDTWLPDAHNEGWFRYGFLGLWEIHLEMEEEDGCWHWDIEINDQDPIAAGIFCFPVTLEEAKEMVLKIAEELHAIHPEPSV